MIGGIILGRMRLEPLLSDWVKQIQQQSTQQTEAWESEHVSFSERLPSILKEAWGIVRGVLLYVIFGIGIGARQAIKYLVDDGRYDYIETGSLISIKKNTEGITIPSEEDRIQMNPMDFEEFRWALGDEATMPLLQKFWEQKHPLGPAHREMARNLRLYMLVGGMPQAVNAYIDTNNFSKVDIVKRRILKLYEDDFLKIDPSGRASVMFRSIPGQLSRNIAEKTVPIWKCAYRILLSH